MVVEKNSTLTIAAYVHTANNLSKALATHFSLFVVLDLLQIQITGTSQYVRIVLLDHMRRGVVFFMANLIYDAQQGAPMPRTS